MSFKRKKLNSFRIIVLPKGKRNEKSKFRFLSFFLFSTTTRIHILLLHRPLRQPINRSYFRAACRGQIYNRNRFPICRERSICVRWKVAAMCGPCINHQSYQLHQGKKRVEPNGNCRVILTYWFFIRASVFLSFFIGVSNAGFHRWNRTLKCAAAAIVNPNLTIYTIPAIEPFTPIKD